MHHTTDMQATEPRLPAAPPVESIDKAEPEWFSQIEGLGEDIERIANGERGVCEPRSYEKYCEPVGIGGQPPWCVYFLAWCWRQSTGKHNPPAPWNGYGYGGFGHTYNVHDWAAKTSRLARHPSSGMMFGIVDGWEHTGLVLGVNPNTLDLYTLNGNWGNCVNPQSWIHVSGTQWRYESHTHTLFFTTF